MTMEYTEAKDEAVRIARMALPLASKYDLPANPINYAVLYEYVSGQNKALVEAVKEALRRNDKLTVEQIGELYNTYISHTDTQTVEALHEVLKTLVDSTGRSLTSLDGSSEEFEKHLTIASEQLKDSEQPQQLQGVVDGLIQETELMRKSSQVLREELRQAQKELEELRGEFQQARKEALIDALTGIQNRRAFDNTLAELCDQCEQEGSSLSLLLLDIDHFKLVNDKFGHVVGDAVLKWFAKIVKDTVKGTDHVARYGGEEFSVLLPSTLLPGARIVAENIRKRVCEQKLRVGEYQVGVVTCSIGVAPLRVQEAGAAETMISNADTALYQAKESGRNKVCLYGL